MNKILIPTKSPEDWKVFLADEKHWKSGYSAKALATCWENAKGFPASVKSVFDRSGISIFKNIEVLLAIPEYKVSLPGGSRASQNDLFVLANGGGKLISIAVEGKVSEDFGTIVSEWMKSKDKQTKKNTRLTFLLDKIKLNNKPVENIRYQLLHRTASAVIAAEKFSASNALMMVHSFSQTYEHFDDYEKFLSLYNLSAKKDTMIGPVDINGINLFFAWVKGEAEYLK